MSLTAVRPYFTAQLTALGFTEWKDGFQDDNIPATLLDRSFFQLITNVSGTQTNNDNIEVSTQVEVRCYFKGYNDPFAAYDEAILKSEEVIKSCVNISSQVGTALKGVYLSTMNLEPLEIDNNDNVVRSVLVFEVRIGICLD